MNNAAVQREMTSLDSERKMSELALKAHQNSLAAQLRGSMGRDINRTVKKKETIWNKIDKFLRML
jgi:hypothetical protein